MKRTSLPLRRREFIAVLGGAAAAWPLAARAQKSLPRIGWLVYGGATLGPVDQSLKDAIAQAGLVDGRNIEIVFRYANSKPDQLAGLADELVAQKPDLLLAVGGDVIRPLFEESKGRIPIVGGVSDSPLRAGLAEGNRHRRAFVFATACRRGDRVAVGR